MKPSPSRLTLKATLYEPPEGLEPVSENWAKSKTVKVSKMAKEKTRPSLVVKSSESEVVPVCS